MRERREAGLCDLNVVLGFQQSPEVVEFYRRFRGRLPTAAAARTHRLSR